MPNDTNLNNADLDNNYASDSNLVGVNVSNASQNNRDQNEFGPHAPLLNGLRLRGVSLGSTHMSCDYSTGLNLLGADVRKLRWVMPT